MGIKIIVLVVSCLVFLAGCQTNPYGGFPYNVTVHKSASELGVMYLLGRGVPQDDEKAFYYFSRAARADDPFAQNELAYLYAAGKGTAKNPELAFYWYQKAANTGLASAEYNLGLMYLSGFGTEKNRALGISWVKKSAAHGFLPAQTALLR